MNARQLIEEIAATAQSLKSIRTVLEDGAALQHLGVTDDDQEAVEEAHALVCGWINAGHGALDVVDA